MGGKVIHGMWKTRLYNIWRNMKSRCKHPRGRDSKIYESITYCEEWEKFKAFSEWALSHGYSDELTLDRKDNSLGYSPDNCRWVSWKEQGCNRSNNRFITWHGKTQTIYNWEVELGFGKGAITQRINHGWSVEDALTIPAKKRK